MNTNLRNSLLLLLLLLCSPSKLFLCAQPTFSPVKEVLPADTSKGILVLVNKQYRLPPNYKPQNLYKMPQKYNTGILDELQEPAAKAFMALCDSAAKEGLWIHNRSSWRTEAIQAMLFERNVKGKGSEEAAARVSARPGHSEHQTGLAVDVNLVSRAFETRKEFFWMRDNAHKFGFIMRYPKGKEHLTGYSYEPWHYRYVGVEVATYIYTHQITYEEYFEEYVESAYLR